MSSVKDHTGQRFGKLQVIKRVEGNSHGAYWQCLCDCGTTKRIRGHDLRSGATVSCGCFRNQRSRERLAEVRVKGSPRPKKPQAINNTDLLRESERPKRVKATPRPKKTQPIANTELLREIERSKLSYCYFLEPEDAQYDARVHNEADITPKLLNQIGKTEVVIRLHTYDHIPGDDRAMRPRERGAGSAKTNFPPFRHLLARLEDGAVTLTEVGRSHWTGGLGNGYFSTTHGRMTDRLGVLLWDMVNRYAKRPNWSGYSYKDEMIGEALFQLMKTGLEFDESKTDNPFAFFTTCIYYSFLKQLQKEKKVSDIRDQMLNDAGMSASQGWQDREYVSRFEPVKLKRKAGRPVKARSGVVPKPDASE